MPTSNNTQPTVAQSTQETELHKEAGKQINCFPPTPAVSKTVNLVSITQHQDPDHAENWLCTPRVLLLTWWITRWSCRLGRNIYITVDASKNSGSFIDGCDDARSCTGYAVGSEPNLQPVLP
jgi:hypothetical protein